VPQLGGLVVKLQDQWGDHLASTGQVDAAISHFVEAGESLKAARAAVDAENLTRAAPLVDLLQPSEHEDLSARLGDLFRASGNLQMATSYYVRAGRPTAAVHMYFDADKFDDATKVQALCAISSLSVVLRFWRVYLIVSLILLGAKIGNCFGTYLKRSKKQRLFNCRGSAHTCMTIIPNFKNGLLSWLSTYLKVSSSMHC
jgi:uncharacterized membrane protein